MDLPQTLVSPHPSQPFWAPCKFVLISGCMAAHMSVAVDPASGAAALSPILHYHYFELDLALSETSGPL